MLYKGFVLVYLRVASVFSGFLKCDWLGQRRRSGTEPILDKIEDISIKDDGNTLPKDFVEIRDHPHRNIIGNISNNIRTISQLNLFTHVAFTSSLEPKNIKDALLDDSWINAMHVELNQFVRNNVWNLVPRPIDQSVVGTK